jgi:hypothetical protein
VLATFGEELTAVLRAEALDLLSFFHRRHLPRIRSIK